MNVNKWKRLGDRVLLKELKRGDLFMEVAYGGSDIFVMLEDPKETEPGCFQAKGAETTSGREVDFMQRDGLTHYGPDLYRYVGG